jgi:hypothetical protein
LFERGNRTQLIKQREKIEALLKISPPKLDRNRVDLSTKDLTRHWCKHFGKSKDAIEAAISKVGDNAETVQKELQSKSQPHGR